MVPAISVGDAVIAQPPVTEAARPSASFFDNNSTQVNPVINVTSQTLGGSKVLIDKSSKPLKMILMTVSIVIVLLGSFAAFYYGYYFPNQPASVVKKAVEKLSKQSGARNFESSSTSFYNNEKVQDLTIKSSINEQGDIRSDISQVLAKSNLSNSLIIKSKQKELYVKVNQPEALLSSFGITAKPSNQSVVSMISSNWLKIDSTSFTISNIIPSSNYNDMKKCTDSFIDFATSGANSDKYFANNIAKYQNIYRKTSNEVVGSYKTAVYKSNYDDVAASKANQSIYQEIRSKVGALNSDCSETTGSELITDPANIKTDSTNLFINSSDELVKAEVIISQGSAKNTSTTLFKSEVLDISAPTNVITVDSLMTNGQDYSWLVSVIKAFVKMYIK